MRGTLLLRVSGENTRVSSATPPIPQPSTHGHAESQKVAGNGVAKLLPPLPSYAHIITAAHPPPPLQHTHTPDPISLRTPPPLPRHSIVPVTPALKAGVTPGDTAGPEPTDTDMPPITMETAREKHPDSNHKAAWVRGRGRRKGRGGCGEGDGRLRQSNSDSGMRKKKTESVCFSLVPQTRG